MKRLGLILGWALLVAAVVMALGGLDWGRLADAEAWQVAAMAGLVGVNLLLTAWLWWLVTFCFPVSRAVAMRTMVRLMCASALLNYLPFRPGLLGRAAYLKARHGLAWRDSVTIVLIVLALTAYVSALAVGLGAAYAGGWLGGLGVIAVGAGVIACSAAATGRVARAAMRRPAPRAWMWAPLKVADVLAAAARLWIAFSIVGQPIAFEQAAVAAAAGLFVSLLGVTPNGLGLREWLIAGLASLMAPITGQAGLAAAVVDRAIEALVVLVAGGVATVHLHGVSRKTTMTQTPQGDAHDEDRS